MSVGYRPSMSRENICTVVVTATCAVDMAANWRDLFTSTYPRAHHEHGVVLEMAMSWVQ
jgi:hypothetical protein